MQRARVIIDAHSAAGAEAGEILIPISEGTIEPSHVKGALSDVVLGKVAGRVSAEEVTVFKSCGVAVEDLVTAQLAYNKALASGIGTKAPLCIQT
jgi:alanine dehydrogenase